MPDDEKKDILARYDQLFEQQLYLRIIANGTAMLLLKAETEIYRLFREQKRDDLRKRFQDISTGVLWMRDLLMHVDHDARYIPSVPEK